MSSPRKQDKKNKHNHNNSKTVYNKKPTSLAEQHIFKSSPHYKYIESFFFFAKKSFSQWLNLLMLRSFCHFHCCCKFETQHIWIYEFCINTVFDYILQPLHISHCLVHVMPKSSPVNQILNNFVILISQKLTQNQI